MTPENIEVRFEGSPEPLVKGTDFSVARSGTEVGTGHVYLTGKGNFTGKRTEDFAIVPKDIDDESVEVGEIAPQGYEGEAVCPSVRVFDTRRKMELVQGTDYRMEYVNNTGRGTATAIVVGMGNYTGSVSRSFEVLQSIATCELAAQDGAAYNGAIQAISVELADGDHALVEGVDYELSCDREFKDAGAYEVTITGLGTFAGTRTATVSIPPRSLSSIGISVDPVPLQEYRGAAVTPKPRVFDEMTGLALVEGTDYRLEYSANAASGVGTVMVVGQGNYTDSLSTTFDIEDKGSTIKRIAGDYANETSAKISAEAFASSEWVVLARDDDFADALGATGVAGALDCPIILTDRTKLSPAAAAEVKRLGAKNVYIIGGTGAMKAQLEDDLKSQCGVTFIERLWGDASYDTSLACAKKVVELGGRPDEAIIAMSTNFQDALSMSSYAYKYKVPVVLQTWGKTAADRGFTPEAQQWLRGKRLIVAGGAGAISDASVNPYTVTVRLWGDTGYDTSQAIAEWMVSHRYLDPAAVVLACGAQAPKGTDALAGAALAGKLGAPVLLVNTNTAMESANTTTVDGFLVSHAQQVRTAYVLGGAYVMPDDIYSRAKSLIGA